MIAFVAKAAAAAINIPIGVLLGILNLILMYFDWYHLLMKVLFLLISV